MRTLTFLFADLRDYTAFVERHGDVAATTLIADYRRLVRAEVAKATGAEIKTEGDSFYVVFEAASDAVRCGVSILREAERYSRDRPDRPMRVGAGIHAGEPQPHEGQYVGGAVIVAARLAQSATAGELLVSEVVRSLLPKGTAPAMRERQGLDLKGIADAPRAFTVGWAVPKPQPTEPRVVSVEAVAPPDRSILCPRVIGRETELAALRALLDEAASGRGRTVLVAGEAGVGKSAVLRAFLELATGAGARVLHGECTEVEARKPFGPFIDAFVAGSLPLPAELSQGAPGAMPVAEVERYRVHGAFAQALAELAGNSTVVVAIEDVHWADSATLELLPYLARKLRERRVLLLCTYRDDELHRLHPLRGTLAELKRLRLVTEIRLPRLGPDAVAAMIKETLRLGRAPTTAFREAIHERCEGNPFFIEEVLRTLVERGDLEYRDGSWRRTKDVSELTIPDSIRDAVGQRVATLTPAARRVLQVAAVIGQRFAFDLLQRVTGILEAELLTALREAIEAQLVHEEENGEDSYRFRHALTRESVLAELMRRERKLLHIEVAEEMERGSSEPERVAEELAYHFDGGGDAERAYRYHDLAARQSERAFAFGRVVEHLERAIELAAKLDPSVGPLQVRLATAASHAMDMARAVRAAEAARATFRAAGQSDREGEVLAQLGGLHFRAGESAEGLADLQTAIQLLEPLGPSLALARAYGGAAIVGGIHHLPGSIDLGRKAIALSEEVGSLDDRLVALTCTATALLAEYGASRAQVEESVAMLSEVLALADKHGLPLQADHAYQNLLAAFAWHGVNGAERTATVNERIAHARRHGFRTDGLALAETEEAVHRGDWDDALRLIEESRSDAYYSLSRDREEAFISIARAGPEKAKGLIDAALGKGARRLSPQDLANRAGFAVSIAALAGDAAATLERAGPLADLQTQHPEVDRGITMALWAAIRLRDRAAIARWAEIGSRRSSHFGHGRAAMARAFAEGAGAWLDGDTNRALERCLASAGFAEEGGRDIQTAPFIRQTRAELFVEHGDLAAARAEIEAILPYWRKAKATWYLGQLRAWAAERGIELTEAETAAAM